MSVNNRGKKILLVDDSKTELHYLSELLGKRGYAVRTAENGEEAMRRLGEETPDLRKAGDGEVGRRQVEFPGRGISGGGGGAGGDQRPVRQQQQRVSRHEILKRQSFG